MSSLLLKCVYIFWGHPVYYKRIMKLLRYYYFKEGSDRITAMFSKGCYLQKARRFEQKDQ